MLTLPPRAQPRVTETSIIRQALVSLIRLPNVWVHRNNVGKLEDVRGRWVTYGLGEWTPDLVGTITIGSPRMPLGIAFGLECKTPAARPGKHREREEGQARLRTVAARYGILVAVFRSAAEAVDLVEGFRVEYTRRMVVLG